MRLRGFHPRGGTLLRLRHHGGGGRVNVSGSTREPVARHSLPVVTCCIDKGLAKSRLVYPGVGNFGDRYFGTEEEQ